MAVDRPVSFVRDVMPVLAKVGCNAGTCHGSAKGKSGFKLSLRGYDPEFDYAQLVDDLAGRRFNRSAPDQSLMLLKPTTGVPHEGGHVLEPESPAYALLRDWIAQGVKSDVGDDGAGRVAGGLPEGDRPGQGGRHAAGARPGPTIPTAPPAT